VLDDPSGQSSGVRNVTEEGKGKPSIRGKSTIDSSATKKIMVTKG